MEKKIKILYVYSSKGFGGIVRNLSILTESIHKDRFDVFVVSLANKGDADSDLSLARGSGVVFCRIDEKSLLDLEALRRIDHLIKEYGIDIVSCHGYKADVYGWILRTFFGNKCRLVTMVHGWTMSGALVELYVVLDMLVMRSFDRIILVSESQREKLRRYLLPEEKMSVICNAVDVAGATVLHDRDSARKEFGLGATDIVIGLIGRLSREKDVGTAIKALEEVLLVRKDARLLVVGDGPEKDRLVRAAGSLGADRRVVFAGHRSDMDAVYGVLDIYVSTSLGEGLPNSLLEAQAREIPCIVTDVPGNRDVVNDGSNGFLVRTGDAKGLAGRILALLGSGSLADAFKKASRQAMRERFSLAQRIDALESLYCEMCEGTR